MAAPFLLLATLAPAAAAVRPSQALTPYMGLDTWYAFGQAIDERTVVRVAGAMVRRGLRAAGYRYVWIDGGWWSGARDPNGNIELDGKQWPHGMRWLTAYIHARGLLAGIYTDAGTQGCANGGSYGHYQADTDSFARWGFDAVKVDFCGASTMGLHPRVLYRQFAWAIRHDRPRRPMLFNLCNGEVPGKHGPGKPTYADSAYESYSYAPAIANSWRTGPDVGTPGQVGFAGVLRNLDLDAAHPEAAGPGHWNDPDYLVPDQGMTPSQTRAQFTLWAMLAAPLVVSEDLARAPRASVAMLTNREAIRIDQDRLGLQGRRVRRIGVSQIWAKRLANGDRAVAFLNRGLVAHELFATAAMLGLHGQRRFVVRDVWVHRTERVTGRITATVPPDGAALLRVSPTGA
jgi:alpha-galactosidase